MDQAGLLFGTTIFCPVQCLNPQAPPVMSRSHVTILQSLPVMMLMQQLGTLKGSHHHTITSTYHNRVGLKNGSLAGEGESK